jgi:hypothetical protein
MGTKHVNSQKMANSQRARQAAARKTTQLLRGSPKFMNKSNKHNGAALSRTGQPKR